MMELTPLDIRKKKGDFRRALRGYDEAAVDIFLDQVADRLELVTRDNRALRERAIQLSETISGYREREHAMNEALISAQQLRESTRAQAEREAELTLREARAQAERIRDEARQNVAAAEETLRRLHAQRHQFLRSFRGLVERHLEQLGVEEERHRESHGDSLELPLQAPEAGSEGAWLQGLDDRTSDPPAE
jgi:cell division initiation protein